MSEGIDIEMPRVFLPLLQEGPRYKVLHGGRGGGKSHQVVVALLVRGMRSPLRVLCCREIQLSIKQSVYQLLLDKIEALGLSWFYASTATEIRGQNGTVFTFRGLSHETADSIKSFEGVDICWIEEAHTITRESWRLLVPTIRKTGSEIWLTFNPRFETDVVYHEFVARVHPRAWVQQVGIQDNPWASETLLQECADDWERDPTMAAHVWGGQIAPSLEGAIYTKELQALRVRGGVMPIPHDPVASTVAAFDLGMGDSTAVLVGQHAGMERRLLRSYEASGESLPHYIDWIKSCGWRIDRIALPHDGEHRSLQTGVSTRSRLQDAFPTAEIVTVGRDDEGRVLGIEEQISAVKDRFPSVWIDPKCESVLESLKRYERRYDKMRGMYCDPLHNRWSHTADAFRYFMLLEPPRRRATKAAAPVYIDTMFG